MLDIGTKVIYQQRAELHKRDYGWVVIGHTESGQVFIANPKFKRVRTVQPDWIVKDTRPIAWPNKPRDVPPC